MKARSEHPLKAAPVLKRTHIFLYKAALDIILDRAEEYVRTHLKLPGLRAGWVLLTCYDTRLSQGEVAAVNNINPNMMVKLVDELEKEGYLKRVKNLENRREYFLELTPKGRAIVKAWDSAWGDRQAAFKSVFAPLSSHTMDHLRDLAIQLIDFEYNHSKPKD